MTNLKRCIVATTSLLLAVAHVSAQSPAGNPQNAAPWPQRAGQELGGTSWELVRFQRSDHRTHRPDVPERYTLRFNGDGTLDVRINCNQGKGVWQSPRPTELHLRPLLLSRNFCSDRSLHDRLVKDWQFVRSYSIQDGRLIFVLLADSGVYEFRSAR